jgi:hypothetical protein
MEEESGERFGMRRGRWSEGGEVAACEVGPGWEGGRSSSWSRSGSGSRRGGRGRGTGVAVAVAVACGRWMVLMLIVVSVGDRYEGGDSIGFCEGLVKVEEEVDALFLGRGHAAVEGICTRWIRGIVAEGEEVKESLNEVEVKVMVIYSVRTQLRVRSD